MCGINFYILKHIFHFFLFINVYDYSAISEVDGEVGHPLNRFKPPPPPIIVYITDRSKVVILIWFSVFTCFGVSFYTAVTFCRSR